MGGTGTGVPIGAGYDVTGIVNLALVGKLGTTPIANIEDTTNPHAVKASILWLPVLLEVLAAGDWKFATTRSDALARLTEAPPFGYLYKYGLPADCLRVRDISVAGWDWDIEGRELVTDYDDSDTSLFAYYIRRVTNPAYFSPHFVKALAPRLAQELAMPILQSKTARDTMAQEYAGALVDAQAVNAKEGFVKGEKGDTPRSSAGRGYVRRIGTGGLI